MQKKTLQIGQVKQEKPERLGMKISVVTSLLLFSIKPVPLYLSTAIFSLMVK